MNTFTRALATLLLLAAAFSAEPTSPQRIHRTLYFEEGSAALSADQREIVVRLGCLALSAEIVGGLPHASSREKKPLELARRRAAEIKRLLQLAGAGDRNFIVEAEIWHSQKENKRVDSWNQRVDIEVAIVENGPFDCEWPIPEGKLPPRA